MGNRGLTAENKAKRKWRLRKGMNHFWGMKGYSPCRLRRNPALSPYDGDKEATSRGVKTFCMSDDKERVC